MSAKDLTADNDKGYSGVIVHTRKGKEIAGKLKDISLYEADADILLNGKSRMISKSISRPPERDEFYRQMDILGFEKTVKRFIKVGFTDRLIESAKPIKHYINRNLGKKR